MNKSNGDGKTRGLSRGTRTISALPEFPEARVHPICANRKEIKH